MRSHRPHQRRPTLRANQHRLDTLVEALLRTETLDAADAYRAAGVPYPVEPDLPAQAPTWSAASVRCCREGEFAIVDTPVSPEPQPI